MTAEDRDRSTPAESARWYDLFSRGARDWLRHNEKIRESVKDSLPELVSQGDVLTSPENRVVRVPVRFLEHYRFRLREDGAAEGVGQGWRMLMECLADGRSISLPALSVGSGKLASRSVGAYARVRRQFRMPIGRFEGIEEVPSQKVRVAFFRAGDVRIELLEPTSADSTIAKFLGKVS